MIFIDAHVHIYDCFDLELFFDSAFANFQREASRFGQQDAFTGTLLLAETSKDNWFQHLTDYAGRKGGIGDKTIGSWSLHYTHERCSLYAHDGGDQALLLIAGRQIVTAEKLEVLALATDKSFKDGAPIEQVIQSIRDVRAIPVIPYGFGKWIGQRGKILRYLLKKTESTKLFLGDNGGRPKFLPRSSHFKQAEKKGIRVLPGTDPLPLPSEECRPGSFGCIIHERLDELRPSTHLKKILKNSETKIVNYGELERPIRFFRNQLLIRLINKF